MRPGRAQLGLLTCVRLAGWLAGGRLAGLSPVHAVPRPPSRLPWPSSHGGAWVPRANKTISGFLRPRLELVCCHFCHILLAKVRHRVARLKGWGHRVAGWHWESGRYKEGRMGPFRHLYHGNIVHNQMVLGRVPLGAGEERFPAPNKWFFLWWPDSFDTEYSQFLQMRDSYVHI